MKCKLVIDPQNAFINYLCLDYCLLFWLEIAFEALQLAWVKIPNLGIVVLIINFKEINHSLRLFSQTLFSITIQLYYLRSYFII